MSLLDGMTQDVAEENKDTLGGNVFVVDSGAHPMVIDVAFLSQANSGAVALNLHLKGEGSFVRQQLWIKSGKAKGNKTYFTGQDGKKQNLPGFSQANHLTQLLGLGKNVMGAATEEKIIKLYDFGQGKEVDTKVEMLIDMVNKPIIAGMVKRVVDKNVKNDAGNYVPSGDTREENEINKLFDSEGFTVAEREGGLDAPVFIDQWKKKWDGVVVDKSTKTAAKPGAPAAAAANTGEAATSIFD